MDANVQYSLLISCGVHVIFGPPLFLYTPPEDMSFSGRAGEAFQSEAGGAEGMFYGPFAAVGYQQGAGCAAGGNVAEDCLIPQIRLGGRGECIIIHH